MPLYPFGMSQGRGLLSWGASVLAGSSPPRSSGRWGSSSGGNFKSSPLPPSGLDQLDQLLGTLSSPRLAGKTGGLHLLWNSFPGYPWMMRVPALPDGYVLPWSGRARWLGLPTNSAPVVWCCLGIFSSTSWWPGSSVSMTTGTLVATRVAAAGRMLPANGVAHLLHLFF